MKEQTNNPVPNFFLASAEDFKKIPGSPIAYWLQYKILERFFNDTQLGELIPVRGGMTTANNDKFVRLWHEIYYTKINLFLKIKKAKWFPYNKGGEYRKWYGNRLWVVNWGNDGQSIKATGKASVRSEELYLSEMIGWTDVTSLALRCFEWVDWLICRARVLP